jgi:hypothetical protein
MTATFSSRLRNKCHPTSITTRAGAGELTARLAAAGRGTHDGLTRKVKSAGTERGEAGTAEAGMQERERKRRVWPGLAALTAF